MPLFFHVSNAFTKRFKPDVSVMPQSVKQDGRPNAWSLHVISLGRSPFVMAMNDAALWPILIPVTGINTMGKFLPVLTFEIERAWARFGRQLDAGNLSVIQFPRSNRSLIGSMNDAIRMLGYELDAAKESNRLPDWDGAVAHLEQMPYSALPESFPYKAMTRIASQPDLVIC